MDEYLSSGDLNHIAVKANWPKNNNSIFSPKRPQILDNTNGTLLKVKNNGGKIHKYILWDKGPIAWWKFDVGITTPIYTNNNFAPFISKMYSFFYLHNQFDDWLYALPLNDIEELEKVADPIAKLPDIFNSPISNISSHHKVYKMKECFKYFILNAKNGTPIAWWNMDEEVKF